MSRSLHRANRCRRRRDGMRMRPIRSRKSAQSGLCDAQRGGFLRMANTSRTRSVRLALWVLDAGDEASSNVSPIERHRSETACFKMFSFDAASRRRCLHACLAVSRPTRAHARPAVEHDERQKKCAQVVDMKKNAD